jgi:hypothetical protein
VEPSFEVCWRSGTSYQGEEDSEFVTADEAPPVDDPSSYLQLDTGKVSEGDLDDPPLELTPCFESNDLAEAKFVADQLLAEGIPATLQNVHNRTALPVHTYSLYPPRVVVRAEDLPRAGAGVKDYLGRRQAREGRVD